MKTLQRFIVSLALCAVLISIPWSGAQAAPQIQELAHNAEAEAYVREQLLLNGVADLANGFPSQEAAAIRGEFIVSLWNDPELTEIPFFKIQNATIVSNIEARGVSVPYDVNFENCTFLGRIFMDSASTKTFRIDDSTVKGSVRLGRMNVDGDLALYKSIFESEVSLFDASVSRNLFARGSRFNATVPDPDSKAPFELWKTKVGQTTEFTDSLIKGVAITDDANFGIDAVFIRTIFEAPASFINMQVAVLADFTDAQFKDTVTFKSSLIDRDIKFTGATFGNTATFDYMSVERFLDFDYATVNDDFSFVYSTVGWPYFEGTSFNGPVFIEGIQTDNDFDFNNASYSYAEEPFTIYLSQVGGQGLFDGFASSAGLDLSHNVFGDLRISGAEQAAYDELALDSTAVNGDLVIDNMRVEKLSAKELQVEEQTTFTRLQVTQYLNLINARLGFFTIDERGFWPTPQGDTFRSNLRGLDYSDIGFVIAQDIETESDRDARKNAVNIQFQDAELDGKTQGVLSKMVAESEFSPQAYRNLAGFLTEKGHPDWAAEVELAGKERERNQFLEARAYGSWLWSSFLYGFSGYGLRPYLAFFWSFLVIAFGAWVFRREDMVGADSRPADSDYNRSLYSFALFLPYIDLGVASKWDPKPEHKFAGMYKHVHRLLGWVLMPIALLTFGGVIG